MFSKIDNVPCNPQKLTMCLVIRFALCMKINYWMIVHWQWAL